MKSDSIMLRRHARSGNGGNLMAIFSSLPARSAGASWQQTHEQGEKWPFFTN